MPDALLPQSQRGRLHWSGEPYGASLLGTPLSVYLPSEPSDLLVFAGIHGNEADTTAVLSAALRSIARGALKAAVVLCVNPDGMALGTRGNANGVDLNRNFPARNWSTESPLTAWMPDEPRRVELSPGAAPASEPETRALLALIERLRPRGVVAIHSDLACIDDPDASPLGRWFAERTGLPLVPDPGYATPGSFGSWCADRRLPVITYELEPAGLKDLRRRHEGALIELLLGSAPGF